MIKKSTFSKLILVIISLMVISCKKDNEHTVRVIMTSSSTSDIKALTVDITGVSVAIDDGNQTIFYPLTSTTRSFDLTQFINDEVLLGSKNDAPEGTVKEIRISLGGQITLRQDTSTYILNQGDLSGLTVNVNKALNKDLDIIIDFKLKESIKEGGKEKTFVPVITLK